MKPFGAAQMYGSLSVSALVTAAGLHLVATKSDAAITHHLKESPVCLINIGKNVIEHFKILARERTQVHLGILEAIFIAQQKLALRAQKDFLRMSQLTL